MFSVHLSPTALHVLGSSALFHVILIGFFMLSYISFYPLFNCLPGCNLLWCSAVIEFSPWESLQFYHRWTLQTVCRIHTGLLPGDQGVRRCAPTHHLRTTDAESSEFSGGTKHISLLLIRPTPSTFTADRKQGGIWAGREDFDGIRDMMREEENEQKTSPYKTPNKSIKQGIRCGGAFMTATFQIKII